MTIPEEVDIIICGGGSAGCVPAGRLANLDHNLQVLLIEAGEDNLNNPWYVFLRATFCQPSRDADQHTLPGSTARVSTHVT